MELYTAGRDFLKEEVIDVFDSVIWTERYFGDGDFELSVQASSDMIAALPKGKLILCESSRQPMIIENREIKNGVLKAKGITLVKWMVNRIFRTTDDHSVKEFISTTRTPGQILTWLVQNFLISGSYLNGTIDIGLSSTDRNRLAIDGLVIGSEAPGGSVMEITLPFGPLYDVLSQIVTTYELGMNINLDYANNGGYQLSFNSFEGLDRTSSQTDRPVVQFSREMDTLTDVTDLESLDNHKNLVLAFASAAPATYMTVDGSRATSISNSTDGFDLRVHQEFDDFTTSGISVGSMQAMLTEKAKKVLADLKAVQLVDGEIVENDETRYDVSYFLGDIVEVIGNSGAQQPARITEYIRSQDSAGERAYPTLSMID